jgi:hypothetical protein
MTPDNASRNTPDRMDVPFVGLATFARQPACRDWDKLDGADVAVLGNTDRHGIELSRGTRLGRGQSARFPCSTASGRRACSISRMIHLSDGRRSEDCRRRRR